MTAARTALVRAAAAVTAVAVAGLIAIHVALAVLEHQLGKWARQ